MSDPTARTSLISAHMDAPPVRLAAAGTDVATIGQIVGHRPWRVVTLRYLHTDDARLRKAANVVAKAVGGA